MFVARSSSRQAARRGATAMESLEDRRLLSYTLLDSVQSPSPQETEFFGQSMASNGSQVLVGASGYNSLAGQAHVLDSAGNITLTIDNPDPQPGDQFGASVAFVGSNILVGAPGDSVGIGKAYLFDSSGNLLETFDNPAGNVAASFGANVAGFGGDALIQTVQPVSGGGIVTQFSFDGNSGTAPVFVQNFVNPTITPGDSFGSAIAVSGSNVLIGAPNSDEAFLFDSSAVAQQTYSGAGGTAFGTAVAFAGTDVIISAPFGGSGGAGVVVRLDASSGSLAQSYENPTPDNTYGGEEFGSSIALAGDNLIVGSRSDIATVTYTDPFDGVTEYTEDLPVGAVYVVDLATGSVEQQIANPTPSDFPQLTGIRPLDQFGHAVAIADGNLLASDPSDNGGQADAGTVYVFADDSGPANQPPAAEAGTYADMNENATVVLDGSGSSDPDGAGDIVTYEWDLDNNGSYETTGQSVNFTQDLPGTYTVGLRVTDSANNASTDTATVTFLDVAPTANAGADQNVNTNDTVNLSGSGNNAAGDAIVSYAWDLDNNGSYETSGQNVSTSFATAGTYTVNFRVTDDDAQIATDSVTITVTNPPPPPPVVLAGGVLTINGGNGNDDINVNNTGGGVSVSINGTSYGTFAPSVKIVVNGSAGDDDLQVSQSVTLPAEIYGGAGNDYIRGGGGNDVLLGGDDNDIVIARGGADVAVGGAGADLIGGGTGRDVLIGGTGADDISGNQADDILIAGSTVHDNDIAALIAIRNEWNSANSFSVRVSNILNGGGLNGSYTFTPDVTVFDDGVADELYGGQGSDWLLFNADGSDQDIVRASSGDVYTDLDIIVT